MHVKGGSLIVTQEHGLNTDASRGKPFGIIMAMQSGESFLAKATLFMDEDGDRIDYLNESVEFEFVYKVRGYMSLRF